MCIRDRFHGALGGAVRVDDADAVGGVLGGERGADVRGGGRLGESVRGRVRVRWVHARADGHRAHDVFNRLVGVDIRI